MLALRAFPLVVWSLVASMAPAAVAQVEPSRDMRIRRIVPVWLVEGLLIAILAGGLAKAGFVTPDLASLIYTAVGAACGIAGLVLLWTYGGRRR